MNSFSICAIVEIGPTRSLCWAPTEDKMTAWGRRAVEAAFTIASARLMLSPRKSSFARSGGSMK